MKSVPKTITQPSDWWEAFQQAADDSGESLSEWIGKACCDKLPSLVPEKLSVRTRVGKPKPQKKENKNHE